MDDDRPLGYWLKHLHNLLEAHFALILTDVGIDRRAWQVLNTLAREPRTHADLEHALAPFQTGDESVEPTLAYLTARGWVRESAGMITLTPDGAATHARLTERVDRTRSVVVDGLTPTQYRETVRILAVMAGNVERAIA